MEHRKWAKPGPIGKLQGEGEKGGKGQRRKGGERGRGQESGDAGRSKMCEKVKVSEETPKIEYHPCNVDEKGADSSVWSKARWNEWYEPCDMNKV